MQIRNLAIEYGTVSKLLHWLITLLFCVQYGSIYAKQYLLSNDSPYRVFLIASVHKPMGILIFGLSIFALIWHLCNLKPVWPIMPIAQKLLAHFVHSALYICMILMPLSGLIFAVYNGRPANFYNLFSVGFYLPVDKVLSKIYYNVHSTLSYIILGLIAVHIFGALYHHFIKKDFILKRMLFGKS